MRRGFRRAMIRNAQPNVPPMLRQAHELMESGRYAEAAEAFEKLARGAETRNHPRPRSYTCWQDAPTSRRDINPPGSRSSRRDWEC